MAIPISSSLTQLNAETFFQEGFELSLDAIVPSIELTGSFTEFESKTQFYIYDYTKTILYTDLDYKGNGSFLLPELGTSTSTSSTSIYNQFELHPNEDIYNQGYSNGKFYAVYNFIDYELGSEALDIEEDGSYEQHPYFIKDISGDRTELRIQNNFLTSQQIETYYNNFQNKLSARQNVDEFYISFTGNRNFIGINSQLEKPSTEGSSDPTSILIKLYQPLPAEYQLEEELQIITKVGETQVFEVEFNPNLEFIDNLLSLKGPNYNIDIKDKVNNSTNFKSLTDLVNTNSSQSYYQFNSLQDQKGVFLTKNWGDWSEFVKFSSAEQRLNNFYDKMVSIEAYEAELSNLETITGASNTTPNYSSSYNSVSNNINKIISKFDSYEYFLYYVTGSESWPKYSSTYPYKNYSVTSSAVSNWFGSTDENNLYYNTGKNQIYSASRYDENNQDYLYYLIPPYITDNNSNDQYVKFVNMTGQTFDEMYLYTEAVEQVRNTNSGLTGSVLPLGMADDVIESLGFETYGNDFNSIGFNVNGVGVFPATGSGLEYIDRYIDIASGSVINYYDQEQSTLGYVIALADPSFPYPLDNTAQEIYKRIFHNMVSLVKRKGTVTGLRQLINIWGVPNTMLRISEFGGKNKDDKNDYDLWMNRYSNALTTYDYKKGALSPSGSIRIPWAPLTGNYYETAAVPDIAVPDCIQFRFKAAEPITATSNFSQSLLVKNSTTSGTYSDFGITLHYSGSQSGSYSGSVLPTTSQYGSLSFRISSSLAGGYRESTPISLPFFNDGWWSVQLQRKTHISASNQNATNNQFELKVANNIYDGYDGNQIGFQGVSTLTTIGNDGVNEAWNRFANDGALPSARGVMLGGYMSATADYNKLIGPTSIVVGSTAGIGLGDSFSGSFQEFRYYRRALSSSQFNDYVMNPESIQGHEDSNTGEGSSYDLLSFRLPLGNELEYTDVTGSAGVSLAAVEDGGAVAIFKFGGTPDIINFPSFGGSALGSLHPSLVNKKGTLYTSSFLYPLAPISNIYNTGSGYTIVYAGSDGTYTTSLTSSYLEPNTQINYMDQPSAGIRNRIKNKIQVIDKNEYSTVLSPFRSIQQEFEQSASYTEDLNSLEVGFSFQNEINDDIIATFGHGVVSDAIADPRFISESSDRYPELTRIANDYFKKYQGITINDPRYTGLPTIIEKEYDYNRLIKFYETSLFKAIKNYVPARTSLSTGIIVKQHLLERNKTDAVIGMHTQTPVAKTPETGSNSFGATTQTGFNSIMSQQNLLITSSIGMHSLTGSAGGSVNKYNTPTSSYTAFTQSYNVLDPFTGDTVTVNTQEEFYDGEFSGSNFEVIPSQYNPYRIFADGNNKNPDANLAYTPPSLNLALPGPYNTTRFPTVPGSNGPATAVPIRATASLVYPSGSKVGAASSDSLLFVNNGFSGTTSNKTIKINDGFGVTRYYVAVQYNDSMQTSLPSPANGKYKFSTATNALSAYSTVTAIGPNPSGTGTETITLTNGTKTIEASVNWAGGVWGNATVTNPDPGNQNLTAWPAVNDNFSGANSGGDQVNFQVTAASVTNGLLQVQCISGTSDSTMASSFFTAVNSAGGHNGSITPQLLTNGSDIYVRLLADNVGAAGNTNITYENNFASNAGGGAGIILASRSTGASPQYLAPTIFQGGVDTPSTTTTYLQNSITDLIPGVQYSIQYTISGIGNDGQGGSNYDIGLSSLSTPGGTANGVGSSIRSTTNGTFTGTWTQAVGQTTAMFFAAIGTYGTLSNILITAPPEILGPKHFFKRDAFTILPTASQLFQASPYNPLLNNVSGSRKNSFLFDQDFDPVSPGFELKEGIPNDYALTISASQLGWEGTATDEDLLEYSEVPDSNYTTKAIINPRYVGCLLESADYNFYTGIPSESLAIGRSTDTGITGLANPPFLLTQNKVQYINGETGSWTGDTSYGKNAVIDRNPINIAHFKSSLESKEYFGTTTFNIDQLIQIPFEEILNEQSPIITSSLINGSNENLVAMSSTFMPGREATIVYNQSNKTFNNVGGTILSYTNLGVGAREINAGGINFIAYHSNQVNLDNISPIQYYNLPIWYDYDVAKDFSNLSNLVTVNNPNIEITPASQSLLLSASYMGFGVNNTAYTISQSSVLNASNINKVYSSGSIIYSPSTQEFYSESPQPILLYTSSLLDENGKSQGILNLRGPNPGQLPSSVFNDNTNTSLINTFSINGPSLMMFNSWNKLIRLGDIYPLGSSTTTSSVSISRMGASGNRGMYINPIIASSGNILLSFGPFSTPRNGSLPLLNLNEKENPNNYYRWNISGSLLPEYRVTNNQILDIEVGDEIRVSYSYFVDPANPSILGKQDQDFTVLGYNMMPPNIWTTNSNFKASATVKFEIQSTIVESYNTGITPTRVTSQGPLPSDGYFSFTELWKRYRSAFNNNVTFNFQSYDENEDYMYTSGSLTALNTHSVVDGTGIIGITASLFNRTNVTNVNPADVCWNMSTNYILNLSSSIETNELSSNFTGSVLYNSCSLSPMLISNQDQTSKTAFAPLDPGFLFDRLVVTPNPNDLENKIPEGKIYAMTLRKRVEADDRVILNANQPSGSAGALTLSGDGYLIPNDLTEVQQRNVQKIINKLKSENVFTQDSPDNLGGSNA